MGSRIPIDALMQSSAKHVVCLVTLGHVVATKGAPPRVRVRIVDVLRGPLPTGERDATFSPPNDESWSATREGEDAVERWRSQPHASPPAGESLIAAVELREDDSLDVWAASLRADSDVERARLRALLASPERALVLEVEAAYAGDGPPPRKVITVCSADGVERIRLGRLFIECAVCGTRQPQSQSRQSPEARQQWVTMHLECTVRG